jgi:hypothetical protein
MGLAGLRGEGFTGVIGLAGNNAIGCGVFGAGGQYGVWGCATQKNGNQAPAATGGALIGVFGEAVAQPGVMGSSTLGVGVLGQSGPGGGPGVRGEADSQAGVEGTSVNGPGVSGQAGAASGVQGRSQSGAGVAGHSASGAGVAGHSSSGSGVMGLSAGADGVAGFGPRMGVVGVSDRGFGVAGLSTRGSAGVLASGRRVGLHASSAGLAGYFDGTVFVERDLLVRGAKSAVVRAPSGELRQLHCLEGPEPWFEDQGEARIRLGTQVEVLLDPKFVESVRGAYQVHVTPYAPYLLWVAARAADRFIVAVLPLAGATPGPRADVPFAWRVTARRADIAAQRFAVVAPPEVAELPHAPPKPPRARPQALARLNKLPARPAARAKKARAR